MQTVKTKFTQMLTVNASIPWRTVLQNVAAAVVTVVIFSWLRLRPLGIFFLALLCYWLYKTRCNFQIKLTTESRKKYKILKRKIMNTKRNFPTLHFVCFATAFASIAIVGHYMIGIFVPIALVFNIIAISLIRNFVEIKRVCYTEGDLDYFTTATKATNNSDNDDSASDANETNDADVEDDDDEEFVPETNRANLAILEKASEITSPTEDIEDEEHSDDIPSELLIPDSIPEINENSTDDEDDELIPVVDVAKSTKAATTTTTTSEPLAGASKIHFKKGHFKNDTTADDILTSSSSEESLSKGLRFPDHTVVDAAATKLDQEVSAAETGTTVANVLSNPLPNLIGGLAIKWLTGGAAAAAALAAPTAPLPPPTTTSKPKGIELNSDSSQESEFEFLDDE